MSPTEYQELVEFLGRQFAQVDRRFTEADRRISEMDQRVTAQLGGMDERITDLRREILGHFDEIYRRLERLEQEYQAITQALRRIEAGLADDRRRREILERDLAELKRHVAVLQSRIEEIEQRLGS
jgi:chromosome segregation ATPase